MGHSARLLIGAAAALAAVSANAQSQQTKSSSSFLLFDLALEGQTRDAQGERNTVHLQSRISLQQGLEGQRVLMLSDVDVTPPTLLRPLGSMPEDAFDLIANMDLPQTGGALLRVRAFLDTDRAVEPFLGLDRGSKPFSLGQAAMEEAGGNVSSTHALAGFSYTLGGGTAGSLAYRYSRRTEAMFGGEGRTQFDRIYDSHGIELALRLRF